MYVWVINISMNLIGLAATTIVHYMHVCICTQQLITKNGIAILKGVFFLQLNDGKKDIENQPGFKLGSSEFQSDALTTTVWFSGWISLRLGKLWLLLKYFVLPPANWVIAAATLYVPSEPPFIGGNRKHFSFRRKAIQSAYTSLRLWNVSVEDQTLTCSNILLWASWGVVMLN